MKFTDRKEFLYDPQLFGQHDTQTALRIHAEYTSRGSPRPTPVFMEVDRSIEKIDTLWHMPVNERTQFTREMAIPCLNKHDKPQWRTLKTGILTPLRRDNFILSNLILQEFNYFPRKGDMVCYNGYRYMIYEIVIDPQGLWQQTNVWLALIAQCIIPPDGDARPVPDHCTRAPAEVSVSADADVTRTTTPLPEPDLQAVNIPAAPFPIARDGKRTDGSC